MPSFGEWHDFFLAVASAGAALTGLVFVAISLHPREIATVPVLRSRAGGAMSALVATLLIGLVQLIPVELQREADAVLALFGLLGIGIGVRIQLRGVRNPVRSARFLRWFLMGVGSALVAAAGIGLALGGEGVRWLYVLLATACFVFLSLALFQCWLLVLRIDAPDGEAQIETVPPS